MRSKFLQTKITNSVFLEYGYLVQTLPYAEWI